ncbi:MAG TPA: hypothetical protein VG734_23065 [Lacunisphaera sp.]|nr:hypothetical protein [Lacunisphaera sp.]
MTRWQVCGVGLLASPWCGCATDLGGGVGVEAKTGHAVGYGRLATSTKLGTPLNDHGFLVGASLESRAEESLGARYDAGMMLGWGDGPGALDGRWGFEAFGEFGTPIQSAFFRNFSFYTGVGVGVPFHLERPRAILDLNDSTWIAATRLEFVPLTRFRVHFDRAADEQYDPKYDLTFGLALRLRMFSDLM